MDRKQSAFTEVSGLLDSDFIPAFGAGTNKKISKANFFDQIREETQIFIYPTVEQLQAADLVADPEWPVYVRVEETGYRLYKITTLAAIPGDIELLNGVTATAQPGSFSDESINIVSDLSFIAPLIGDRVETKGCLSIGDGGHGTFIAEAASGTPDGYGRVLAANGLHLVLQPNNGIYYANQFGASTSILNNSPAINRGLEFVKNGTLVCGYGIYACTDEIIFNYSTTLIGVGKGYLRNLQGEAPDSKRPSTVLQFTGTGAKSIKTRVKYRGSALDPEDDPISTALNIQMDGVTIENLMVDLYCDYDDDSPTNYGDDWDVGIFHGSRQDLRLIDVNVGGYWRQTPIWLDSTRGVNLPELNGYPYTFGAGADGISLVRVNVTGGRWGIRKQGPLPKPGFLHFGFQYKRAAKFVFSANPADGDTLTVGSRVFTYRITPSRATDVQIGANAALTIASTIEKLQVGILTPYDSLTYIAAATELRVYSTSSTATALSETSASISVQTIAGAAATQTETISDPAPYYDNTLGLVDDGRCSLGASDTVLDNCVICSVEHHSKYRKIDSPVTLTRADVEDNTNISAGSLWISGLGGSAVIHRFFAINTRFQSVEPFNVRINHAGRCRFTNCTADTAVTRWKSTTGAALTEADTYGKYAGSTVQAALLQITGYDDPGSFFPLNINNNQVYSHFYLQGNDITARRDLAVGRNGVIGYENTGTDTGSLRVQSGASANAELIMGNESVNNVYRQRVSAVGGITFALRAGGTGALTDVLFLSALGPLRILNAVPVYADDAAATVAGLASGSIYRDAAGVARIKI